MQSDDEVIDLAKIILTLRAGWRVIAGCFVVMVCVGLFYVMVLAVPIYTAKSVVVLDTRTNQVIDLEGIMGGMTGGSDELNTEVEVLRSRGLATKVVAELDLTDDPEFNGTLKPPSIVQKTKALVRGAGAPVDPVRIESRVVDALLSAISVRNVPASFVFEISATSLDPAKAAKIADTLAKRYILNQIEVKFESSEQATEWLSNRVSELKTQLEVAQEKAKAFNSQTSLVSPELLATLEVQNKDLRERVTNARTQAKAARERVAGLKRATTFDERIALAQDVELSRLPKGDAFETRYAQVIARAELDLARADTQQAALIKSQEALEEQISRQGDDLIQLQQLTRDVEASSTLYEYFLSRLKETSAQQGIQQADSRILSTAVIPAAPTAPRKKLILVMCALLGGMIGVGMVLVREMLQGGFRAARELEQETGIVVMGQVPLIPGKTRADIFEFIRTKPASAAMEAIRNLRTSVLLSNVDAPPKVIVLTSSLPSEGKTTNALALALNMVGTGKSVLLVEGDIRRNMLAQYFPKAGSKVGLVSVLSGTVSADEALMYDAELGLTVLMGQQSNVNAADLFMSEAYRDFLAKMRARFDYIIIDTPPVLVVPDARIIAQSADAVLLTVRWNSTTRSQLEEALHLFSSVNQRVSGLILSQVDTEAMKRYGAYYGSTNYGAKYYVE